MSWHPILILPISLAAILVLLAILYVVDLGTRPDIKIGGEQPFDCDWTSNVWVYDHDANRIGGTAPGGITMLPPEVDMPSLLWPKDLRPGTHRWHAESMIYTPNGPVNAPHPPVAEPRDDKIEPDDADNQLGWKR